MKLPQNLLAQMREATRNLLGKGPAAVTATLQQALAKVRPGANAGPNDGAARPVLRDINPPPAGQRTPPAPQPASVRDAATDAADTQDAADATPTAPRGAAFEKMFDFRTLAQPGAAQQFAKDVLDRLGVPLPQGVPPPFAPPGQPAAAPPVTVPGAQFLAGVFANQAGSRSYKLYIPSTYRGQPMPLLVMLHGCTQNPDDFAVGTQMNAIAEEKGCLVVYPEQSREGNPTKCWNWFSALDQQRDQGEPSIIAGIARQIAGAYAVDPRCVFVAGLSAGGAMAVIVGTLYPDLFAAVGAHSGLPFASAKDLPSALAAMRGGAIPARKSTGSGIPIIVFHGDRDTTVNPRNGDELIAQGLRNLTGDHVAAAAATHSGSVPNGHRYTKTTHLHTDGKPLGEHWVIHGAGHAWSGGSEQGSYTDSKGPDASREMMRFFHTVS